MNVKIEHFYSATFQIVRLISVLVMEKYKYDAYHNKSFELAFNFHSTIIKARGHTLRVGQNDIQIV